MCGYCFHTVIGSIRLCFSTLFVFPDFSANLEYVFWGAVLPWKWTSGLRPWLRSAVISPCAVSSLSGRLRMTGNFCLLPSHFPFSMSSFHCYLSAGGNDSLRQCLLCLGLWCLCCGPIPISSWDVISWIEWLGLPSCLFWLASQHSGVVLTGHLVSLLCIWPVYGSSHSPHVTSVIERLSWNIFCVLWNSCICSSVFYIHQTVQPLL